MFGSGSSNPWASSNQPQRPGQTSGFGATGFGSSGTTGTGTAGTAFTSNTFGQQPQPPQSQTVNPMFGGATTNTPGTALGTSGFGAFGGSSAFGQKPTTGFGAFGGGSGTTGFGSSTSTFGQPSQPTGQTTTFGQPSATSTFTGGLFGQKSVTTTGGFGSTSTEGTIQPITTGSLNPPYQVYTEKEPNGAQTVTLHYQSITAMPAYRNMSFEELRVQDYAQGRKTAGAFGQSAFGIGQPTQQTTSAFGQPSGGASAFGSFGQTTQQQAQAQPTGFGSFGQPATSQPSAFGGGTGTSAFGTFGQQQPQQQTGIFGSGTSTFGQPSTQQQPSGFGTGAFGQTQQPKPFGTFGTGGTSAFGGGGAFGQGTQSTGQTGQTGQTSIFGQPATGQPQATGGAFGGFGTGAGTSAINKPSIFGQPNTQPQTTGFGMFGQGTQTQQPQPQQQGQQPQQQGQQPQQQQQQPQFGQPGPGTSIFGQPQAQPTQPQAQPQQTTNIFGQQQSQPATSNVFGSTGTTGIFGQPQTKPAFGTSIFGQPAAQTASNTTSQPQTTGVFGGQFGQQAAHQPTGTGAFGGAPLFGQKPATSIFGQTTTQPSMTGLGQSFLGTSALGGTNALAPIAGSPGIQTPGALTASVAEPVSKNLPIFSLLQPNTLQSTVIEQPQKKAPSYFVDIPHRSSYSLSASRMSASGKLRGFGSSQAAGLNRLNGLPSSLAASTTAFSSTIGGKGDQNGTPLLGPEAFLSSGLRERKLVLESPRKLVLDRPLDPSMLGLSGKGMAADHRVDFIPTISISARIRELSSNPASKTAVPTTTNRQEKKSAPAETKLEDLKEGDYWVEPSLEKLRSMSNGELSSFSGLRVGRKGYGEVHFLENVDLTALPRLSALLGRILQIESKEVCVYPESEDGFEDTKPQPGEGINVRARVILLGCWPLDKATREPIKDEKHPSFIKHLKRLKNMKHTHFESYDVKDGKWTFTVDHF